MIFKINKNLQLKLKSSETSNPRFQCHRIRPINGWRIFYPLKKGGWEMQTIRFLALLQPGKLHSKMKRKLNHHTW